MERLIFVMDNAIEVSGNYGVLPTPRSHQTQNDIPIDKTSDPAYLEYQHVIGRHEIQNRRTTKVINRLKSLIQRGQPAIGSWIGFADPYSVELMADLGFDWLLIDTEHFPLDRQSLRTMVGAMKGSPAVPVVRLASNSPDHFQTALDLGAQGVVVPMISSREEALQAVDFCRYPPLGRRGFSPTRASHYFQDLKQYASEANEQIALIVQIETPRAVENIEEILTTRHIDGIFIGPGDLASFMNLATQTKHPDVETIVARLIRNARAHEMPFGLPTWTPDECLSYIKRGACLLTIGSDLSFMAGAARANLSGIRNLLEEISSLILDSCTDGDKGDLRSR